MRYPSFAHTLTALLSLSLALPALARNLTGAEKNALGEFVTRFETAYRARDYWVLGAAVPPRVLKRYMAARGKQNLERDQWLDRFVSDSKEIDRQVGNVTESFSLDFSKARFEQTPNGTPYAILPSTSLVKLRTGDRLKVFSPYLALQDDGKWYLINVGFGGLMGSVKGLYHAFDKVEFNHATQKRQ